MTNFNKDSVFNLKPIELDDVRGEVHTFLIDGEELLCAFKTIRDQVIFTNKRIISIDVQGITGKRKSFTTLPYSKIQYFTIQTQGFLEIFPDNELYIEFSNGFTATFEFKGNVDICQIGKIISTYALR
ncbi:MAG: PH domain-containing protein [Treponema sp.]|uniref:PH domain-containing protein n=1 Tax=Treponema sp. TaxID=166 RepID=UPI00298E432D|nr:PH domain-containing protein [Treponema sp.]MCQ2600549.1 PH domain-containing protein [Treponema sp.]